MTLILFDSARKYVNTLTPSNGMIAATSNMGVNATNGRDAGPTFQSTSGGGSIYYTPSRTWALGDTIIIGMHLRPASILDTQIINGSSNAASVSANATNGAQFGLSIDATGHLVFNTGSARTTRATSVLTLNATTDYFIEIKVTLQTGATGTVQVVVDGIDFIGGSSGVAGTSLVTYGFNTALARVAFGLAGTGGRMDVFYIADNQGSFNNDFFGNVTTVKPAINGNSSVQFTPSAGSNYQCVDENPANDDTDYNHSDTVGHKDLFTHAGGLTGTILGVQSHARVLKESAGTTGTKQILSSGGTESKTALVVPALTYTGYWQIRDTDPLSGVQITASEANAMLVGYENTITP